MTSELEYRSVHPIGDSDPSDMPVVSLERAVGFYHRLGFEVEARSQEPVPSATIRRGGVTLRLAENGGDPEQASCYLAVSDVDQAWQDLKERGSEPGPISGSEHDGKQYRVFFLRDPEGLCYCIGAPA